MLRQALVAEAAALATFLIVYALCVPLNAGPAPAILGTVIALGLARRPAPSERVHVFLEAAGVLAVAIAAGLIGSILRWNLLAGGLLFSVALAASVWLRGLHDDARIIGRVIALPFIAILVVPIPHTSANARWLLIVAPLAALAITSLMQRMMPTPPAAVSARGKASTLQPPPHVRMALQMFVALLPAFLIGTLFIRAHWPWIVLSAFIVCSGALGRADAVHKGLLRLAGALGGGIIAAAVALLAPAGGVIDATVIFAALLAGLILRNRNYAYWAACTTLVFAMLQRDNSAVSLSLYLVRLGCIFIGAACGIVATCTILPMKTSDVARRRLADALAALESGDTATAEREAQALERLAPPLRLHRMLTFAPRNDDHPAVWIAQARQLFAHTDTHVDSAKLSAAIKNARRAIRDKDGIGQALQRVRDALTSSP